MTPQTCALCSEAASQSGGPFCIACMANEDGMKFFIENRRTFTIYLKSGGAMRPFKTKYDSFGLLSPKVYLMYISVHTGNLFVGQITEAQPDKLEYINIRRINRSSDNPSLSYDRIQYKEVVCALLPA